MEFVESSLTAQKKSFADFKKVVEDALAELGGRGTDDSAIK